MSLSISFLAAKSVHAYVPQRGNVVATLSPYFFQTNYNGYEQGQNKLGTGLALVANGDVDGSGSLEIAAIYMQKTYFREDGHRTLAERTQLMHITMGYRRWWTEMFSSSLSLYTSYPMGIVDVLHNDFTPADDMSTTARSTTETGLELAVQYELVNRERFSIIGEGRYSYSLTKKSNEYADQYGASIGIRYFIQSKVASPKELRE